MYHVRYWNKMEYIELCAETQGYLRHDWWIFMINVFSQNLLHLKNCIVKDSSGCSVLLCYVAGKWQEVMCCVDTPGTHRPSPWQCHVNHSIKASKQSLVKQGSGCGTWRQHTKVNTEIETGFPRVWTSRAAAKAMIYTSSWTGWGGYVPGPGEA